MRPFEYVRPSDLGEASRALVEQEGAVSLAGGTDLLVQMKKRVIEPKRIVDLKGIPGLDRIENGEAYRFGALVSVREIEVSRLLQNRVPVLCQAAGSLGSVQVRNRGTVGGNLCNGSPAGDMSTVFLAMDAEVRVVSKEAERTLKIDSFFVGPQTTALRKGEILTEVVVPRGIEAYRGIYLKAGPRKAMDIGVVSVALLLRTDGGTRTCEAVRIALGSVAPTPMRARQAEAVLTGHELNPRRIAQAAEAAASEACPISDLRGTEGYRREVVRRLVARGISNLLDSGSV